MVGKSGSWEFSQQEYPQFVSLKGGSRLMLPIALYFSLEKEAAKEADKAKEINVAPAFDYRNRASAGDLACIRAGTEHDLADAQNLAAKMFKRTKTQLDGFALGFSRDLFVAVALYFVYQEKRCTFPLMLGFLSDPAWEDTRQIICALQYIKGLSLEGAAFLENFHAKTIDLEGLEHLIGRCAIYWRITFASKLPKKKNPVRTVPIFRPEAVAKALGLVASLREESRAGGTILLKSAQHEEGRRTVPNASKAVENLEAAKSRFENLVEPITRLQTDLTLAAAMPCEDFRITPILLLGDPGIGKTYLATQLAESLGVSTEKISAGGAQGGFQLTGSHTSWHGARAGSLFTLLAEGKSAAPVLVIDEVDKIHDSQYPVLPVLLDLFEPDTAKLFKDEFFDMQFDASRVIFVLTANSLEGVPSPLLSRLEVFDVPRPEPEQRLRIIEDVARRLRRKTKTHIELDKAVCERLADRTDLDLRKTTRLVKEAFSKALAAGERVARFEMPQKEGRRTVGFGR